MKMTERSYYDVLPQILLQFCFSWYFLVFDRQEVLYDLSRVFDYFYLIQCICICIWMKKKMTKYLYMRLINFNFRICVYLIKPVWPRPWWRIMLIIIYIKCINPHVLALVNRDRSVGDWSVSHLIYVKIYRRGSISVFTKFAIPVTLWLCKRLL